MPVLVNTAQAGSTIQTRNGASYTVDAQGYVTVNNNDVVDLLNAGFMVSIAGKAQNNLTATTDPGVGNDSTQDYAAGSLWLNTTTGRLWDCEAATAGAAIWNPRPEGNIGRLIGANMNSSADQAFVMLVPATAKFRVTKITADNASTSLTTAAGGVYPAAAKGGTALVASTQVYSALTAANIALDLTLATPNAIQAAGTVLRLSLTTPQGGAATADLYAFGDVLN